jgi:hypothetical protein
LPEKVKYKDVVRRSRKILPRLAIMSGEKGSQPIISPKLREE